MYGQSPNRDGRAVAPVVGVLLMIGITVLLAATTGAMVLGMAEEKQTNPPQAAFAFDYDADDQPADNLTVTHEGGDAIAATDLQVVVTDARTGGGTVTARADWTTLDTRNVSAVGAGNAATVSKQTLGYTDLSLRGARAKVVWRDPATGQSIVLAEWDAPSR